jgi:hypothetical protein
VNLWGSASRPCTGSYVRTVEGHLCPSLLYLVIPMHKDSIAVVPNPARNFDAWLHDGCMHTTGMQRQHAAASQGRQHCVEYQYVGIMLCVPHRTLLNIIS